ncbi:hypothetical protein [Streptomyces cuspidosporus]|uniref:Cytochrome C oxidase subunit I n=1 Tax=Streptomyces cuspidosporus TaxID=66882 RepID=A0ABN3GPW7_9ACTN
MPGPDEIESGIARLEGYLLCQRELGDARAEAEAYADRLPWLTTTQREEVVRLYAEERVELSRRMLRRIADRCEELRAEYTARYEELRRRLLYRCVAVVLVALTVLAVMGAVALWAALGVRPGG